MNKILIDTEKYDLVINKNDSYSLDITCNTDLSMKVLENISAEMTLLIKNSLTKISITMNDNSSLLVNQLAINSSLDLDFSINNNSNLEYIDSLITSHDSINNINIYHKDKNSTSKVIVNGINASNNKLYVNINGVVNKESLNTILEESSQIINLKDGDSKIIPNLIIDNNDVIANHSAFIGNFKNEDIYYLMTRGLSKEEVDELLLKATLLNGMKLKYDKSKFIYVIKNDNWR